MGLEQRLNKIEQAVNADGEMCECKMGADIRKYPGEDSELDAARDERPAQRCALCGKPKLILKVVYTRHWRREDEAA